MNKRISTEHCFVSVVGPAESRKTRLIGRMIINQEKIFSPHFYENLNLCKHYQPHYGIVMNQGKDKHAEIEVVQRSDWHALEKVRVENNRTLLVIDDLSTEASETKEFLALVIAGRRRNVHLRVSRHNSFQKTKNSKKIDLNLTQIILFDRPRYSEQIGVLGRQLGEPQLTKEAYKTATEWPFGYLIIDIDVANSNALRYCFNYFGDESSIFYFATEQLHLSIDIEFTKFYRADLYKKFPTV